MKRIALLSALIGLSICSVAGFANGDESQAQKTAAFVGSSSGLPGGICVVLGREDTNLAVALSKEGKFFVQALYSDNTPVDKAREAIRSAGADGQVSAEQSGCARLPYAENLINILVVDSYPTLKKSGLSIEELLRVLAPLGSMYFADSGSSAGADAPWVKELTAKLRSCGIDNAKVMTDAGTWVKATKPWPKDIDQWTHYLHGPDGNAVAQDTVVGPPKHYQWTCGPLWARSHETDSSVRTLVTANGRIFYIFDEAPISLAGDNGLPGKWCVMARDAFNGTFLWKVPIKDWGWRQWKNNWFSCRPGDIPLNIQKRLVAVDDRVYVTLGYHAPVSEMDAKTGKVLKTYKGTDRASEILYLNGTLVLTILTDDGAKVMAVNAKTGETIWVTENTYAGTKNDYYRWKAMHGSVKPPKIDPTLNTATDGKVVAFLDGLDVVGLDFKTGKEIWRTKFPDEVKNLHQGGMKLDMLWVGTLIVTDGVVLHASPSKLVCFAADTGKVKWSQPKKYIGHLWYEWKDVFVIDGLVWTWSAEFGRGTWPLTRRGKKRNYRTNYPLTVNGYDLQTGELKKKVDLGNIFNTYHHHRCYRNKATVRYILASRRGSEFVDLIHGKHTVDNWVRGLCHMGMMPANGLQYTPPHPCACYIDEKLNGFNALAPEIPPKYRAKVADAGPKTERGPAFNQIQNPKSKIQNENDWPTFRHDSMRSGSTKTHMPKDLKQAWRVKLGGKVAAPIVVADKVFVPLVDKRHLLALNASNGSTVWEFTAGGRIDSPPTYHNGTILFGSADGWVYCLRATDGALAWKFRAAPEERQMGAFGQLESVWPVPGTVLVQNDMAYFVAGRSSHLDGGLYLYGLDAATGEVRCQARLEGPSYTVDNIENQNYKLPMGSLPDILQGDGQHVCMRNLTFDSKLEEQKAVVDRIRTRSGFLDDAYFKRVPWSYGKPRIWGRLIVMNDNAVYCMRMFDSLRGLDPTVFFTPGKKGYLLIGAPKAGSSQIKVANSKTLNVAGKPLTVEAWVKAEKPDGVVVGKGGAGTGFALWIKDGKPRFGIRLGGKVQAVCAEENIVGRWVHLVGQVTKAKQLRIYVNGRLAGEGKASGYAGPSGQAMEIGVDLGNAAGDYESPFPFTGAIDEVRMYYRELTPEEIGQHYANPGQPAAAKDKSLALYFSFNDGEAKDLSGNGNNGDPQNVEPVDGKAGKALMFTGTRKGWERRIPVRIRAMVATDDLLFTAGPPDVVDPKDPLGAFEGRKGGILNVIDTSNGKTLSELKLPAPPVFNGAAAARGRLYLTMEDGSVACYGK
ncbi:MAG: PQQ-binding-like beta-propeller repeat protein [Planctomycetes bacterium]|nr:PQQ-binding-like beta-propeller repeat protein [Planctomycetota bacterium]